MIGCLDLSKSCYQKVYKLPFSKKDKKNATKWRFFILSIESWFLVLNSTPRQSLQRLVQFQKPTIDDGKFHPVKFGMFQYELCLVLTLGVPK